MARPRSVPKHRRHRQSGQAVTTLTDGLGGRRDVLLGKYGTAASRQEYARVIAEWEAAGRRLPSDNPSSGLTINQLALAFLRHADQHYRRPDGTPTSEAFEFKMSLRPLVHLYGHTPAADFGPLVLKAVRKLMVEGYEHPKYGPQTALSRGVVNHRTNRIRRAFKWSVANELVPASVLHALQAVSGLQRGRTQARETEPIGPVHPAIVAATLPHLNRHVAAMVRVQQLTGARPGEVCILRACDIDMTGHVWLYRPGSDQGPAGQHKTAYAGRKRVIAMGPQAQAIIKPFLTLNTTAFLFDPRKALEGMRADMRARRKSKVPPSQQNRRRKKPQWTPGGRYTTQAYYNCICRACKRANRDARAKAIEDGMDRQEAEARVFVPAWNPHMLRHTHATEVRRRFGLEAAQVALGHAQANVTEVYAERDLGLAVKVAQEIG
jgi:integrase